MLQPVVDRTGDNLPPLHHVDAALVGQDEPQRLRADPIAVESLKSTGLYRSFAALASFSGTFDLILFQAVNFEFIVEKAWFGMVWIDGNKQTK